MHVGTVAKQYWTYIMASRTRILYVGMTNDLARRVAEHKALVGGGFTSRYRVPRLVYAEEHPDPRDAIRREKEIKGWLRVRKVALVEFVNPSWADLAADGANVRI